MTSLSIEVLEHAAVYATPNTGSRCFDLHSYPPGWQPLNRDQCSKLVLIMQQRLILHLINLHKIHHDWNWDHSRADTTTIRPDMCFMQDVASRTLIAKGTLDNELITLRNVHICSQGHHWGAINRLAPTFGSCIL